MSNLEKAKKVLTELKLEYRYGYIISGLNSDLMIEYEEQTFNGQCSTGNGFIEDISSLRLEKGVWIYDEEKGIFVQCQKEEGYEQTLQRAILEDTDTREMFFIEDDE